MANYEQVTERFHSYFKRLVPAAGPAETEAGEIVRALGRITYRFYNDGDQIGVDYGNETCNPAARFLQERLPENLSTQISELWSGYGDYEKTLLSLVDESLDYLDSTNLESEQNLDDFLDWQIPEDTEYWEDECEEDEYWEDECEEDECYEEEWDDLSEAIDDLYDDDDGLEF